MYDLEVNTQYNIENYKLNYRACIPFYILLDKDLSKNELALYGLIEQMESSKTHVFFKRRTLAKILGVSHESGSIKNMTRKLKGKGYITHELKEVAIKGNKCMRWVWGTAKSLIIDDEIQEEKNGVPELPPTRVPELPPTRVPELPPCNTHNFNTHNSNSLMPDSTNTGKNKKLKDYEKDERFMRFYNAYPKKRDPRDTWKAFKKIVGNNDELLEEIINDINQRKLKHSQWKTEEFIKYPAVYLRKGEYEGEIYNEAEEREKKAKLKQQEADRRLKEQEQYSRQQAENELNKQRDAIVYRKTTDAIRNAPPKCFSELKYKLKK